MITNKPDVQTRGDQASDIAEQLGETSPTAIYQIIRIIAILGIDRVNEFLQETLELEKNGGLLVKDGSRRRTPGGTFLYLVKTKGGRAVHSVFWMPTGKPQPKKQAPPAAPQVTPLPPAQNRAPIDKSKKKKETTVKLTLVGRPASKILDKSTYFAFALQVKTAPSLPKGLPTPAETTQNYVCYVASKQWRTVAEALVDDEQDQLILEGFPQVNPENGSIKVFASNVTTKNLQKAKRASA